MPGALIQTQVSINLTGNSSVPDNFTIKIYPWDSATDAVSTTSRTYATGVSRSTTSAINGGTLISGYGISPIYQTDYQIELISTTTCTTSAIITVEDDPEFLEQIKSIYQPLIDFTVNEYYPNTGQVDTVNNNGMYLIGGFSTLATVEILPYLDAADFTVNAGQQRFGDDMPVYDQYQYGPFSSFIITKVGKILTLKGNPNQSLQVSNNIYKGSFTLTYVPSNEDLNFTYCYHPGTF
jgi:hypothetical protein